jgi:hypothetical protein
VENTHNLTTLDKLYADLDANQDEYLDALLDGIRQAPGYPELLKCIYENLYNEKDKLNKVSSLTDAELAHALEQLKKNCAERKDLDIPPFLELLENLMAQPDFGVAVRWAISRLVGLAVTAHYMTEAA